MISPRSCNPSVSLNPRMFSEESHPSPSLHTIPISVNSHPDPSILIPQFPLHAINELPISVNPHPLLPSAAICRSLNSIPQFHAELSSTDPSIDLNSPFSSKKATHPHPSMPSTAADISQPPSPTPIPEELSFDDPSIQYLNSMPS